MPKISNKESLRQKGARLKGAAFQKLICNLLLDLHPICIARWLHPLNIIPIHKYYLNFHTIYLEYAKDHPFQSNKIRNIYETLIYAAESGNIVIFKWCLKNKACEYVGSNDAIFLATENGHLKIVKMSINAETDKYFLTQLLQCAAYYGHLEIVKFLLEKEINVCGINGTRALQLASHNCHLEIVKLLKVYNDSNKDSAYFEKKILV